MRAPHQTNSMKQLGTTHQSWNDNPWLGRPPTWPYSPRDKYLARMKPSRYHDHHTLKPQARKYSVQCISEQGSVLSISLQELIQRVQVTNETNLINFISQISHEKSLWRKFFHEQSQEVLQGYKNLVSNACSIPNHINRELAKLRRSE